jgi:hypothetical protein
MRVSLALSLLLLPGFAFAHGTKIKMVAESTTVALAKFEAEEAAAVQTFSGTKTWLSGADAKVRVYYDDNANSIYYTCVMQHTGGNEQLVCTKD